jgi:hypothetical protein
MAHGLHKWRESTATSPSGKHLGIYRTLTKAYLFPPKPPKITNTTPPDVSKTLKQHYDSQLRRHHIAKQALCIQHMILTEAIKRTHTLERWRTIHNFFLEKLPGRPLLDKLRVIHLYEADWNLILKFFIAYQLNTIACQEKTVAIEQAGGRPGRTAEATAAATVLFNEIILLQRMIGAILYNDAKACFDRIVENISNLSLLAEGLHPAIAALHAQTLREAKYHIKTLYGIGECPNGHMAPDPFYGTGQGAADSMPRWGILSDKAINAYNKHSKSTAVTGPLTNKTINTKIRAFVDDTNCPTLTDNPDLKLLKQQVEQNTSLWEKLLFTIGGKLELTKCKFSTFAWHSDKNGTQILCNSNQLGALEIPDSETRTTCQIEEIPSSESYKLLGVQMALDGNTKAQEQLLQEKCTKMARVFHQAPLSKEDCLQGYTTVLLPTLKYGLMATAIPWYTLTTIQKTLTNTILPKMGYNRRMPRAVVHAPEELGGLGLQQLATEQGIAHVKFTIGSIRTQTEDATLVIALLESYIITAGIMGSPLVTMMPVTYVDARWIESTRIFLNSINATIQIPSLKTITPLRLKDRGIMEVATQYSDNPTDLIMINNCRLYLRVHTIAEISSLEGTAILQSAYTGNEDPHTKNPVLWQYTKSTLQWPHQPRPPQPAWNKWKQFLDTITRKNNLLLRRPLGEFTTPPSNLHRVWTMQPTLAQPPAPAPKHHPTEPIRWTSRVFSKLTNSSLLNIIIQTTKMYEDAAFRWTIADDKEEIIMETIARIPTQLYSSARRPILLALTDVIYTVQHEHRRRNAAPRNTPIHIWVPCTRTIRTCLRYGFMFHTASTATKDDSELYRYVSQLLKSHPQIRLHKLHSRCPETIKQQTEQTRLHKLEMSSIQRIYEDPLPSASLVINNQQITCNLEQTMRTAYASQTYREYLQKKHKWDDQTTEDIDWNLFSTTYTKLANNQRRTLTKFLHGWLPTNAHAGRATNTLTQNTCPLCRETEETNPHFLECRNDQQLWEDAIQQIFAASPHPAATPLIHILHSTLNHPNENIPDPPDDLPLHLYPLYNAQHKIGFNQLVKGRWSKQWIEHYDQLTQTDQGLKWASSILRELWKAVLEKWKRRCTAAHQENETTTDTAHKMADTQIDLIYDSFPQIDTVDRRLLQRPSEEIKKLPLKQKRAWIRRTQPHITESLQRAKTRQQMNTRPLTAYFATTTHGKQPNHLRRPQPDPHTEQAEFDPP